jgi:hypothetical protein
MSNTKMSGVAMSTGVISAIAASLCCIVPVIALLAGSTSMAANFSWLEPARPYLISFSIAFLAFAWYHKLTTDKTNNMDCCEPKRASFFQSKTFLAIVTVFAALMITFPLYAKIFYPMAESKNYEFVTPATGPVTFYEVPLVCNAAPTIGCGSRSKPALLELERNAAVKEAWLNRSGTVIAIVWKDKPQTETVAKPIFEENNIPFTALTEEEAMPHKKTFAKDKEWYRGGDVDKLSVEEAGTIAESAVKFALENKLMTKEEAKKIKKEIEEYFKVELVKVRTNDQLNEDSENKFREDMFKIAEKYLGKERAEKSMELYEKSCEEKCEKNGACKHPGSKKDCCDQ